VSRDEAPSERGFEFEEYTVGISDQFFHLVDRALSVVPIREGARMAELGSQFMNVDGVFKGPAKEYFEARGVQHDSFDLDGQFDAVVLDLGEPLSADSPYVGAYDILTNFGTSEHVVQHYDCFRNIHRMCRVGAVMLHTVPAPDHWAHHGRYYYPEDFFTGLARANEYEVISLETISHPRHARRDLTCALLRKDRELDFMPAADFEALPIVIEDDNPFVGRFLPQRGLAGRIKRLGTRLFGDRRYKL
jgi:hypothetical protein